MNGTFYDILAAHYDVLQSDMDCGKWADYISSLISRFCSTGSEVKTIIDLGCGTGSVDIPLARHGYEVIGIDNAESMLEWASSAEGGEDITWVLRDITELEMDFDADCFVSLLDTLDHITDEKALAKIFKNVADHLLPGGVMIFDVITEKHLSVTFGDNIFYQDYEDFLLLWVNHYDAESRINTADLTFFEMDEDGKYDRYDGELVERFYSEEELIKMAEDAGLVHKATFGELSDKAPSSGEERIFMVFAREDIG